MPGQDLLGTVYVGEERITASGTAQRLTVPAAAGSVFLSIAGNPVRIRFDPAHVATATTGHLLPVGTVLEEANPGNVSILQDATLTGGVVEITYYD